MVGPLPACRYESSVTVVAVSTTTSRVTASLSGNIGPKVLTVALCCCAIAGDDAYAIADTDNFGCIFIMIVCGDSLPGEVYEWPGTFTSVLG